jgi:hypothetical protein
MLRNLAAHQDTWKGQAWLQWDINWPNRSETGRLVKAHSVQCRQAVQFAYAERPDIAEATSKQVSPNPSPYPLGMDRKVTYVRFPFSNLSASRLLCGPTSASDNVAPICLSNIVGATCKQ